uniref:Uncharacterized protein n=1 Tax=Anguilla anguilla TaxID=7936 RepID=A0A0E9TH68_ANGAN
MTLIKSSILTLTFDSSPYKMTLQYAEAPPPKH